MKKLGLFVLFLALVPVSGFSEAAPTKVAVIHMQAAISSVSEGKKAQDLLKKEWEGRQKKLQVEGKKVQDAMENLRKQAMVMDEKTRREKEEAIQNDIAKLRENEAKSQMEFQKKDQEVSEPIIKKIRVLVGDISKEKGYTLVIDGNESNVIFALAQDDITQEVIKRYDSKK